LARARDFDELLEYLRRQSRGVDLSAYKRSSLGRRVEKRMQASGNDVVADILFTHRWLSFVASAGTRASSKRINVPTNSRSTQACARVATSSRMTEAVQ